MPKDKLKVVIFTEQDYAFLFPAWKKFLDSEENYHVVGIFVFPNLLGKHKGLKVPLYYLKTFGIFTVLKLIWITTVATFKRYFTDGPHSYKDLAHRHSAAFEKHSNPNKQQVINRIKELDADIILSTCGYIFKKKILDAPKIGVINKHAGPLPSYRGLMPVFWTLLEGKQKVGVTIHFMDKEIDKGTMILQHIYTSLQRFPQNDVGCSGSCTDKRTLSKIPKSRTILLLTPNPQRQQMAQKTRKTLYLG